MSRNKEALLSPQAEDEDGDDDSFPETVDPNNEMYQAEEEDYIPPEYDFRKLPSLLHPVFERLKNGVSGIKGSSYSGRKVFGRVMLSVLKMDANEIINKLHRRTNVSTKDLELILILISKLIDDSKLIGKSLDLDVDFIAELNKERIRAARAKKEENRQRKKTHGNSLSLEQIVIEVCKEKHRVPARSHECAAQIQKEVSQRFGAHVGITEIKKATPPKGNRKKSV